MELPVSTLKTLLLALGVLAVAGCSRSDQWTAFVYPDINEVPSPEKSEKYIIGNFKTFNECQAAAIGKVRANMSIAEKQGAYICGLNCTNRKEFGNLLVCEDKRK